MASLLEVSLSRIHKHFLEDEFVILAAWKGEREDESGRKLSDSELRKVNTANTHLLARMLKSKGYGFVRLEGFGPEAGGVAREASFLVINKKDDPAFLDTLLKWAGSRGGDTDETIDVKDARTGETHPVKLNFKQETIIHHTPGPSGSTDLVDAGSGAVVMPFKDFKAGAAEFFSRLVQSHPISPKAGERKPEEKKTAKEKEFEKAQSTKRGEKITKGARTVPTKTREFHFAEGFGVKFASPSDIGISQFYSHCGDIGIRAGLYEANKQVRERLIKIDESLGDLLEALG